MSDNFNDAKAGDEVAIRTGFGYKSWIIYTIDRVTPTTVIIGSLVFAKSNGRQKGQSSRFNNAQIEKVTDEIKNSVKRADLLFKICACKIGELATNQLERIYTIMQEPKQ